jgi:hypothetical protein
MSELDSLEENAEHREETEENLLLIVRPRSGLFI